MIHKGRGIHFNKLIAETQDREDTPEMVAQLSHSYRASFGSQGRYVTDNCGVVLGIKSKAVVYSVGERK